MASILLSGFEPFDGARMNPALEIVRALDGWESVNGDQICGLKLPCVFGEARLRLRDAILAQQPDIVIALGQAMNRPVISLERVALNFIDAPIPDNAGQQPIDCAVIPGAPVAWFSTLPLRQILARLQEADVLAEISQSAGSYVCNELFYGLMHQVAAADSRVRAAGFIHVPGLPEQFENDRLGMPLTQQIEAIRIAVLATLDDAGRALSNTSEGRVS